MATASPRHLALALYFRWFCFVGVEGRKDGRKPTEMEIDAERKRSPHPNPKPEPNPKPKPLFTLPYICVQETIDRASERYRFTCASCALSAPCSMCVWLQLAIGWAKRKRSRSHFSSCSLCVWLGASLPLFLFSDPPCSMHVW